MESFWTNLSVYSGMISTSVVAGGIVPVFISWTRKKIHFLLSFSAGLMLGATLIHLLPSSFELMGKDAPFWVLVGFLFLYLFEKFVTVHICELLECERHQTMGIAAAIGISAHAFSDGIALGSGLLVSELGLVVFLTIFFHKLPEAIALTTVLLHEEHGKSRIVFFNLLLIAMVPLGAILVHFLAGTANLRFAGIALAFSAGTFLHISLSDLLPHVHEHAESPYPVAVSFLTGMGMMFLLERFLEHGGLNL